MCLLLGIFLLAGAFYGGTIVGKDSAKVPEDYSTTQEGQSTRTKVSPESSSEQKSLPQLFTKSDMYQIIRIYPSLSRKYSFYIYPVESGATSCFYGIRNQEGTGYEISEVLGSETISCLEEQGALSSSFVGWVDGDKFLIDEGDGEVKIVDVGNFELESYKYDSKNYQFIGANRSLKYWLFRKVVGTDVLYSLLNRNSDVVLENIKFTSNDRGALYDEVNDGFLFINRTFTDQNVSIKFDFLSLSNLSLRTILTTDPVHVFGMGCATEFLISQPGEIILTLGCLTVSDKYLGSDGNIHIKL